MQRARSFSTSSGESSSPTNGVLLTTGLQPFQCPVCLRRFTRHENLKRHAVIHQSSTLDTKFSCFYCEKTFARRDLRKRHLKKQHPDRPETPTSDSQSQRRSQEPVTDNGAQPVPVPSSSLFDLVQLDDVFLPSDYNLASGVPTAIGTTGNFSQALHPNESLKEDVAATSGGAEPLDIASLIGSDDCASAAPTQVGTGGDRRPSIAHSQHSHFSGWTDRDCESAREDLISQSVVSTGVDLFFRHISGYLPFIHKSTFSAHEASEHLLMAMLSVSLQFMDEKERGTQLGRQCFLRGKRLLEVDDESRGGEQAVVRLDVIQAYILLELHAIMISSGSASSYGLRMHSKMIELARTGGLTDPYPTQAGNTGDLESLWRQSIRAESHKRTLFAAYNLDVLWYHTLSLPRTLSHLEIKHDLPCPEDIWTVTSASDWAHKTLVNKDNKTPPRYLAAVRACVTPNASLDLSSLDAHGSLMIIGFLLSSVREMSGWSTMTGKVCTERFEALHVSLLGFEPIIEREASSTAPMSVLLQAAWHTAIIELLLWSPSHTNGVVERSLDAAMAASARLSNSLSTLSSPLVASSVERHLQWFLTYLDTATPETEAPWMPIFAYKAVLITWQLVRTGCLEPLRILGVADADAMLGWIKEVFGRRKHWVVGRTVVASLCELDTISDQMMCCM
ncbi:hypothetical protein IAT40_005142 [Kwoniella sp. CBS 6097]